MGSFGHRVVSLIVTAALTGAPAALAACAALCAEPDAVASAGQIAVVLRI